MTKREARPALNDFVAGYPGPADIQFQDGSITIVAVLVYADGIRIEWQMPSAPHQSPDELAMDLLKVMPKEGTESQEFIEAFFRAGPMRPLWAQARLSDDHGREFELCLERSGPLDRFGGAEGTATCRCEPPTDSKALTLHLGGADIVIPLTTDRRPQDGRSSLFKAGYPGPKNPIPFHDGAIKIISALLYDDRVRIEWLIDPAPDLSWLFKDTLSDYLMPRIADEEQRLATARWSMNFKRTFVLWFGARLTDDQRTTYRGSLESSGVSASGFKGAVCFTPGAPSEARELNLVLYDLSLFIPLGHR
jgi:hypothetical protein